MSAYCHLLPSAIVTWAMTALIRPLHLDDLEDLSRFLTAGSTPPQTPTLPCPKCCAGSTWGLGMILLIKVAQLSGT